MVGFVLHNAAVMSPEPATGLNEAVGSAFTLPRPDDFVQDRPTPRLVDKPPDGCH